MPSQVVRDTTLSIRISHEQKELIDRAAETTGKNRTAFMIDSALRAAEDAILDQRLFRLDGEEWEAFARALDAPPGRNPELRRLLDSKAPWEAATTPD